MSFLNSNIDLSATTSTNVAFTNEHLDLARAYLTSTIRKHEPSWLRRPTGPLSVYWKDSAVPAACYLIELSRILSGLEKRITKRSQVIYAHKLKGMLRARKQKRFDEIVTELQVASSLSERVSPIDLNPLVPEELLHSKAEPPSPDLAVRLPDGDVLVEVTVLHFGLLLEWDRAVEQFTNDIWRLVKKRNGRRAIYLHLPLSFGMSHLGHKTTTALVNQVLSADSGRLDLKTCNGHAVAVWEPLPHVVTDGKLPQRLPPGVKYATFGPIGTPPSCGSVQATPSASDTEAVVRFDVALYGSVPCAAVAFETRPLAEGLDDLLLNSLRDTLKRKRHQFPHEAPYLLAVKLGHHRISADAVARLLTNRIWPNDQYARISGICLFKPRVLSEVLDVPGSRIHDSPASLHLFSNPGTRNQVPEGLISVFEG